MFSNDRSLINILEPIKRRVFLLIGRGKLTSVTNSKKTQLVQGKFLKDETISDIERVQEYGFDTYPKKGTAEEIAIFPNGNRDRGIVICIQDNGYRPTTLEEGEVQIYDWNGSKIYLKKDNSIYIESKSGCKIDLKTDGTFRLDDTNGNYIKSSVTQLDLNGNLTVDK
jgi:phage baseplate assembly protein V